MDNENTRHSTEWETDFEQSLWSTEGEGVESLVDNENDETKPKLVHGLACSIELLKNLELRYIYTLRLVGPISYLGGCYRRTKVTKCIRQKMTLYFRV